MSGIFEKLAPLADVTMHCLVNPLNKVLKKGGYLALSFVSVIAATDYFRDVGPLCHEGDYGKAARELLFGLGWLSLAIFIAAYHFFDLHHDQTPDCTTDLSDHSITPEEASDERIQNLAQENLGKLES